MTSYAEGLLVEIHAWKMLQSINKNTQLHVHVASKKCQPHD